MGDAEACAIRMLNDCRLNREAVKMATFRADEAGRVWLLARGYADRSPVAREYRLTAAGVEWFRPHRRTGRRPGPAAEGGAG